MNSKLIFPYQFNSSQNLRKIESYTEYGLIDNGRELIDLSLGSCGCFPLGFKRTDIIDYVAVRMKDLPFCSGEFFTTNDAVLELGERLYNMTGGYRSIFALSGSDANEGALRLAQLYNGRNKFLGFKNSYHGSTYLSSSVSDATYMTNMFGKDSRCVISDYNLDMITNDLCAVIIETSSWQNGLYDPGKAFWAGLRTKCTDMGIVLILDDIAMCGGKTGNFVGWKNSYGEVLVEPDIFTMGKALTGGYFPLSACLANETIFNKIKNNLWCHGFTYVFSLTGIFSTLAYLNILENEKILDSYPKIESWAIAVFTRLVERGLIKKFNHHGLFFNLELLNNKPLEEKFEKFLYQYGISAGLWNEGGNGLLVVIPLNAPANYFEELEFKLITALTDYRSIAAVSN